MFKVNLTVIDTPGFGDYINNKDSWLPVIEFLDDQHESYMRQEQQPVRQKINDLRVHVCLYFIRPTGHTYVLINSMIPSPSPVPSPKQRFHHSYRLTPLDIEVMKRLGTRVNLIPVIAKADTLTPKVLAEFKRKVRKHSCWTKDSHVQQWAHLFYPLKDPRCDRRSKYSSLLLSN